MLPMATESQSQDGFGDEAPGLLDAGEALAGGKELLVGRQRPGLVPEHGAQLRLHRDARTGGQGPPPRG